MINCVSNIAWEFSETEKIFNDLKKIGINNIEVAPLELIDDWKHQNIKKLHKFKDLIKDYKITVSSFQSIFYKQKINLLENPTKSVNHIYKVKKIMDFLECNYCVIGSPKNRFSKQDLRTSKNNFNSIFLKFKDINFGIEAAPIEYGSNFLTNYIDVNKFVNNYSLLNTFIHFDTGCNFLSYKKNDILEKINIKKVKNAHYSKSFLKEPKILTKQELSCLNKLNKKAIVSLEMKKTKNCIASIIIKLNRSFYEQEANRI